MYYTGRNMRQQRGGMTNYLMPFLIIICIGVIGVLLVGLWNAIFNDDVKKAAYMHIEEGSAEMKTWGTEEFFNISTDALIMQGDEIVTSADAKIIVEFFDGTIMRVDGNTDINFVEIDDEKNPPLVKLLLVNGKVWFNKLYRETGDTYISVETGNLEIVSQKGNIFTVENGMDEIVRVFSGSTNDIEVNVFDKDGSKVVETEAVGVGQEATFNDEVLDRYWQFQSPSVIVAIDDAFKTVDWYLWNFEEDKAPTVFEKSVNGNQFVKVEPEILVPVPEEQVVDGDLTEGDLVEETDSEVVDPEDVEEAEVVNSEDVTESPKSLSSLAKPSFTNVSGITTVDKDGYYVVDFNPAVLNGSVSGDVASVVVNDFTLKKFTPGSTTWTYYANASYDFMEEGANTYVVYAIDADGNKSEPLKVKVMYNPKPAPVVEAVADPEPVPENEPTI